MKNEIQLLHGDCLERLKELPNNSVDSIVTDPPYGLSFMGKKWDYDVPSEDVWSECLRVLKPGGHLLAFAGTRTQHRMAVRIEDAGFEIRDMIAWVYSTGFPKSHNFGCKCGGSAVSYTHEKTIPGEQKAERDLHTLRDSDVSEAVDTCEGGREVLQSCVQEQGSSAKGREELSSAEVWSGKPGMEGRSDVFSETRELQANQVYPLPEGVFSNGEEGRVCDGTQVDNGEIAGKDSGKGGGGASCKSQSAGQQVGEPNAFPEQSGTQVIRGACEVCGKLKSRQGWGTAIKPALEPITVARKPLIGTVAENVLKHGTGAINVDGCRVGAEGGTAKANIRKGEVNGERAGTSMGVDISFRCDIAKLDAGRWPANLIHDGSDEVVELFPNTKSGKLKSDQYITPSGNNESMFAGSGAYENKGYEADQSSAARFFYCAKASKRDRNEGCDHLPEHQEGLQLPRGKCPDCGAWRNAGEQRCKCGGEWEMTSNPPPKARNNHPTVKPTDLMRYLCRLVTPPGGIVLDPFMGSGSTGKAASLEGFQFIGIEREENYMEIAKARIEAAKTLV